MSREIVVTRGPVRIDSATAEQELRLAPEVLDVDELELELRIMAIGGSSTPTLTLEIETGMQRESTLGWVNLGTFSAVASTSAPASQKLHLTGLLRFIRWKVNAFTGSSPTAVFAINGLGRSWVEMVAAGEPIPFASAAPRRSPGGARADERANRP